MTLEDTVSKLLRAMMRIPAVRQAVLNAAQYAQPEQKQLRPSALDETLPFLPKQCRYQWQALGEFYDRTALVAEMKEASKAIASYWNHAEGTPEYRAIERQVAARYVHKAYTWMRQAMAEDKTITGTLRPPRFDYRELMMS